MHWDAKEAKTWLLPERSSHSHATRPTPRFNKVLVFPEEGAGLLMGMGLGVNFLLPSWALDHMESEMGSLWGGLSPSEPGAPSPILL